MIWRITRLLFFDLAREVARHLGCYFPAGTRGGALPGLLLTPNIRTWQGICPQLIILNDERRKNPGAAHARRVGRKHSLRRACHLLQAKGFRMRVSWSHHIFTRPGIIERINVQREGSKAKPYQVKQVRKILALYKLI
jgi:hypothetical protein